MVILLFERIYNERLVKTSFILYEGLRKALLRSWRNVRQLALNQTVQPYQSIVITLEY